MAKPGSKNQRSDSGSEKTASKGTRQSRSSGGLRAGSSRGSSQLICREPACDNVVIGAHYCRLHYIKNWQRIKRKEAILQDDSLRKYMWELMGKFPEKYIDAIRQDLLSDEAFIRIIKELDIQESEEEFTEIDSGGGVDDDPLSDIDTTAGDRDDDF